MNETYFLRTERLGLRMMEAEDAEGCFAWSNDPEVCQYNAHHRFPQTVESEKEYIQSVRNSHSELVLAMIELESGRHIGNISL